MISNHNQTVFVDYRVIHSPLGSEQVYDVQLQPIRAYTGRWWSGRRQIGHTIALDIMLYDI